MNDLEMAELEEILKQLPPCVKTRYQTQAALKMFARLFCFEEVMALKNVLSATFFSYYILIFFVKCIYCLCYKLQNIRAPYFCIDPSDTASCPQNRQQTFADSEPQSNDPSEIKTQSRILSRRNVEQYEKNYEFDISQRKQPTFRGARQNWFPAK